MAEMQRLRRYGLSERERLAGAAGWNEVVRHAREMRGLGINDGMLEVLREVQRIKTATVSLPPAFLNEICAALEKQRWAVAYRAATLELLTGCQRLLQSRRLRLRNLVSSGHVPSIGEAEAAAVGVHRLPGSSGAGLLQRREG